MKRVGLFLLFLLLLAPSATSQVPDDKLIVSGQRIGKWTLEMTLDDLVRMNGPAVGLPPPPSPLYVGTLILYSWRTSPLTALTRDRRRTDALMISGPEPGADTFKTEKSIGIGSTRSSVIAAYANPPATIPVNPTTANLIYDEIGIAFNVVNDRVDAIWVFRTRTAASVWRFQATTQAPVPTPSPTPRNGNGY